MHHHHHHPHYHHFCHPSSSFSFSVSLFFFFFSCFGFFVLFVFVFFTPLLICARTHTRVGLVVYCVFLSNDAAGYTVEWNPAKLSWKKFRNEVLGPTDPVDAPTSSLRGQILANWKELVRSCAVWLLVLLLLLHLILLVSFFFFPLLFFFLFFFLFFLLFLSFFFPPLLPLLFFSCFFFFFFLFFFFFSFLLFFLFFFFFCFVFILVAIVFTHLMSPLRMYTHENLFQGLKEVPNVGDNGVHASASPFEALAERLNWLGARLGAWVTVFQNPFYIS
jgi:hypothetical protein